MKKLVVDDVSMIFTVPGGAPIHALQNVSLELEPGEIMTILGPSGCGKTTLLNIVAGFLAPTAGEVRLEDQPITGPGQVGTVTAVQPRTEARDALVTGPGADRGMVFQKGALFEWMTVEKNISFGPDMAKKPRGETTKAVARLLESSDCRISRPSRSTSSPAACSSAWRWRGAWRTTLTSSSWTSLSARSTR